MPGLHSMDRDNIFGNNRLIRLLDVAIMCMELDQPSIIERPLGVTADGVSAVSNAHICLAAIPHPSKWDDVWLDRIKALTPKDLIILHKQYCQRGADVLQQV